MPTLFSLLEKIWIKDLREESLLGKGTIYALSGFSNFNGGVRFYNNIEEHILRGGKCRVILGGSANMRMSSKQIVSKLMDIGCNVGIINRKAIFHAKCYGFESESYKSLVVSSGNFTSRGLTQNVEASLMLNNADMHNLNFSWEVLFDKIESQKLDYYKATTLKDAPFWRLLFDEEGQKSEDESIGYSTMILTLSHSDTARIQAGKGTNASLGTQYFWLSKDSFDFFPALNQKNKRGSKNAYQALINVKYKDLNDKQVETRITFEADNNLDFRLGTGILKGTGIASEGDMAALTRIDEKDYEMRIFQFGTNLYTELLRYAVNYIGHQGKRYGYIENDKFFKILKIHKFQ